MYITIVHYCLIGHFDSPNLASFPLKQQTITRWMIAQCTANNISVLKACGISLNTKYYKMSQTAFFLFTT